MDSNFKFIGDNKQLLGTIKEVEDALGKLQNVADKSGIGLDKVLGALSDRFKSVGGNDASTMVDGMGKVEKSLDNVSESVQRASKSIKEIKNEVSGDFLFTGFIDPKGVKEYLDANKDLDEFQKKTKEWGKDKDVLTISTKSDTYRQMLKELNKQIPFVGGDAQKEAEEKFAPYIEQLQKMLSILHEAEVAAGEVMSKTYTLEITPAGSDVLSKEEQDIAYAKQHEGWYTPDSAGNEKEAIEGIDALKNKIKELEDEYQKAADNKDWDKALQTTEELTKYNQKLYEELGSAATDAWKKVEEAQKSVSDTAIVDYTKETYDELKKAEEDARKEYAKIVSEQEDEGYRGKEYGDWGKYARTQRDESQVVEETEENKALKERVELLRKIESLKERQKSRKGSGDKFSEEYAQDQVTLEKLTAQYKALQKEQDNYKKSSKDSSDANKSSKITADSLRDSIAKLQEKYHALSEEDKKGQKGKILYNSINNKQVMLNQALGGSRTVKLGEGDTTTTFFDKMRKSAEQLKGSFADLGGSLGQSVRGIKMLGKGGAESVKGLSMLAAGIKGVGKALTAAFVTNPIGIAIAAIVAVIALLVKSVKQFFTGTEEGEAIFIRLKGVIAGVKAVIENFMENLGRWVVSIPKQFKSLFDNIGNNIKGLVEMVKNIPAILKGEMNMSDFFSWNSFETEWKGDSGGIYEAVKKEQSELDELLKKKRAWAKEEKELEAENAKMRDTMYSGGVLEQMEAIAKIQGNINEMYAKRNQFDKEELAIKKRRLIEDGVKFDKNGDIISGETGNASRSQIDEYYEKQTKLINNQKEQNSELSAMSRKYKSITNQLRELNKQQEKSISDLRKSLEKEITTFEADEEIVALQNRLKYESDYTKKLEIEDEIRKRTLDKTKEQLELDRKKRQEDLKRNTKSTIEKFYNKEAAEEFERTGKITGTFANDPQNILANYQEQASLIDNLYATQAQNAEAKSDREYATLKAQRDIDNYVSFLQEKLELDKWYAEQQEELALGNLGKTTSADLKRQYDAKMQMALKDKGIDATEMEVSNMAGNMIALISGVSADAIEKESQAFFKEIDKMIEQRKRELLGDNYDDYTSQQGIIDTNTAILNDENATDDQKQAAEDAITEAKAKQLQYETQFLSTDSQLLKLEQTRKTTQDAVLKVQSTATQVSARDTKKQAALWSAVADMMNRANSAVRGIAETLGDSLSPEGQKALNTMAEITEFATSSISSIQYVTETSTRLMETTANSAAGAIRMVETASVILAVISLAIQAIQAIVKIVSQYSAYQEASDRLEDQKEKVAALVKENGKLEKSYKKLEGTSKYFKGMSEQAKDYDQIIAEQEKAVQAAEDMVASAKTKKKREEAEKALEEQKDLLDEYKEKQDEVFRQLQQELMGTDLASFSESLADAFVEGFEDGTMSMKESFEQTIDDMMKTMMKKQLASKIGDIFSKTFEKFNDYTADGELTNKEMQAIMSEIEAKSAEAELLAGQYQQMMEKMGLLDSNVDAKSGGFSAMSQDTAEELNGRFTSLQMTGISLLDNSNVMKELLAQTFPQMIAFMQQNYQHNVVAEQMAESQIDQLKIIADNTGLLAETNRRLANIQSSTDKL